MMFSTLIDWFTFLLDIVKINISRVNLFKKTKGLQHESENDWFTAINEKLFLIEIQNLIIIFLN